MARKRVTPLLLVAALGVALLVAAYLLMEGGLNRAGRGATDEASQDESGAAKRATAAGDRVADAARIAELIATHGAFTSRGRVLLTRPAGPGPDAIVRLRAEFDGLPVEAVATTDGDGRFTLARLPRGSGYELTVESDRLQPFRHAVGEVAEEHDFGDLFVDRYYFVTGRVVAGAQGVAGAEVSLISSGGGTSFSFLDAARGAAEESAASATTESGADGRFELRLTDPGIFTARARLDGWATNYKNDIVAGAGGEPDVTLTLSRGYEVVGYVLDGAGGPLTEASVSLVMSGRQRWWQMNKEITRTDGSGRFDFRVEPVAARYSITVVPKNGVNLNHQFNVPLEADLLLRLPGTNVLSGRVVDAETKQPVAGADILIGIAASRRNMWTPEYAKALRTDTYGAFRLEGVGEGILQSVSVRASGFAQMLGNAMFSTDRTLWNSLSRTELGQGEARLPDIPLARGRVLQGRILDKATGEPIPGAAVELTDFFMGGRTSTTNQEGLYRFDGVGDRVAMAVSAAGYAEHRDSPMPGLVLTPDEPLTTRDIELEPGGSVAGTVRDSAGAPLAGALVRLRTAESGRNAWISAIALRDLWTYTASDGTYRLEGVPPLKLRAEARAPGFDAGVSKDAEIKAGKPLTGLDVALLVGATAEGVVAGQDGTPVEAARITIARDPGPDANDMQRWTALASGVDTFTDERGRFRAAEVPVGDIFFRIEAEGYATKIQRRRSVEPGQKLANVRLELAPALQIAGRVVDESGNAVANCWIQARQTMSPDGEPSTQAYYARVNEEGVFEVNDIGPGAYRLEVRFGGWAGQNERNFENLTVENISAGTAGLALKVRAGG